MSDDVVKAFQEAMSGKDMFLQFLDMFPYTIEIFAPDGTSVYVNRAGCGEMNIADPNEVTGHYNVIRDPVVNEVLKMRDYVERAFRGETIGISDVRVPYEDTGARYTKKDENFTDVKFQDIFSFPLWGERQQIAYIVMIFQTKNVYKGKSEIVKALEYMDAHWLEEYDIDKIAKTISLSPYHFSRLFKQHMNETPFGYYKHIKVKKLKEALRNPNLNITQAFAACGVDYNGNYAQIFKDAVGMTPSKYREGKFRTQ